MAESSTRSLSEEHESCRTVTKSDLLHFTQAVPRQPYLSFIVGPCSLRRLIIKIWSHDESLNDAQYAIEQPDANSVTSFALGIIPESSDPSHHLNESHLCEIHRNGLASDEQKCYTLEWKLNTPYEGEQSDGDEAQGWLESISSGSCVEVGVFPLAGKLGWVNVVHKVTIEMYDDNDTALSPATCPASERVASQMIKATEADAESTSFQTNQMDEAQAVLDQIPDRDPDVGAKFNALAIDLGQRYQQTGSFQDLTGAIELTHKAIEAMPDNHQNLSALYSNLGVWLGKRYVLTRSIDDLTTAIEVAEKAIQMTPPGRPELIQYFNNLGSDLRMRYDHTRIPEDLTRAIDIYQKVVKATSDSHPLLPLILDGLGNCLGTRYSDTGRLDDLASAITVFDRVVKTVPSTHPNLAKYSNNLAIWLRVRFEVTGSIDDLERAIEVVIDAVENTPSTDVIALAEHFNNLGLCLDARFLQMNSLDDLDGAIASMEGAIALIPEDHPDLAAVCSNLGKLLSRKSDQRSLTRAIEVGRKAIEAADYNHRNHASYFTNLTLALSKRFEQTGSLNDLTAAIETMQKAVEITPNGHPHLAAQFNNLANYLCQRHDRIGLEDDFNRAFEACEKAVEATPSGDIGLAGTLSNLSIYLCRRYKRTGAMDDLTRAIEVSEQAVTKSGAAGLSTCLSSLSTALRQRYKQTRSMDDLIRANEAAQKAVEASRGEGLSNYCMILGISFIDRYDQIGLVDDLTKAIEAAQQAVEATHHDDIYLASNLRTLGDILHRQFERSHAKEDQDARLSAYVRACHCTSSPPSDRIHPAKAAADIYVSRGEWDKAYDLLREALTLLPKLSQRSLSQSDMQNMLSPMAYLATEAAAIALNAGKSASEVLSVLEPGRGVIAGLLIDSRGDLSDLKIKHPSLAERFEALRDELDVPAGNSGPISKLSAVHRDLPSQNSISMTELSMVNRRHQASREFDEVIEQIRARDEFHDFLQSPPAANLSEAAGSGPIVVVNVSTYRCDAILVQSDTVRQLQLPGLKFDDVMRYTTNIAGLKHDPWHLLEWLWTTVCKPCLDALGFKEPSDDGQWPHVWWIPTGPLSQLPLHAAGIYTPGSRETVLDRVVSSYASSIKALQHGRRRQAGSSNEHGQQNDAILVAMEQTKRQMALPNATTEIDKVRALCPLLHLNAVTPPRRKANILEHLKTCKILHFAGHGESRPDPSQSRVLLDDWEVNPLTVSDLRESWLQESPAFLAYLSACSTGSNQGKGLADEAIHLVSAFQLAGFRHVVGTLWEVSDPHCVDVAAVLYQTLCDEGMTDEAVSHGLHRAVRKLRNDSFREGGKRDIVLVGEDEGKLPVPSANTFWIPYVHFGV